MYESIFSSAARLITGPTSVSSSQPDAEPKPLGRARRAATQLVVDRLVRDHAARRGAALAGGSERRPDDALDGQVEIRIVHDDDRVLAAELEVDVLEAVGAGLRDRDACLARAGERDDRDVRMPDERIADLSPAPVDDVDDAGGTPASISSSTKRSPSAGVSVAGLKTTVLPQTSAGSIFQLGIAIGKFHGVITPTTPIGWRTLMLNLSRSSDGVVWPNRRRPSPPM